jgi:predicted HTH domain antitoxin
MKNITITLELPEEVGQAFDSPEEIPAKAREALVLQLLREARISQGRAARLLGITRYDILDLMALHHIPSGPVTAEEMQQEIENVRRYIRPG